MIAYRVIEGSLADPDFADVACQSRRSLGDDLDASFVQGGQNKSGSTSEGCQSTRIADRMLFSSVGIELRAEVDRVATTGVVRLS